MYVILFCNCNRSGTVEDFTEKDTLLQEVLELQTEAEVAVRQQAVAKEEKETIGLDIRKRAMEGMSQGEWSFFQPI